MSPNSKHKHTTSHKHVHYAKSKSSVSAAKNIPESSSVASSVGGGASDASDVGDSGPLWDPLSSNPSSRPGSPIGLGRKNLDAPVATSPARGRVRGGQRRMVEILGEHDEDDNAHVSHRSHIRRLSEGTYWTVRNALFGRKAKKAESKPEKLQSPSKSPSRSNLRLSFFFGLTRYPLLSLILLIICLDLIFLTIVRMSVFFYERISIGPQRKLLHLMSLATTYESWQISAAYLDAFMKNNDWKELEDEGSEIYNSEIIRKTTKRMKLARSSENPKELVKHLSHACKKNHGGCMNEGLYSNTYLGTKKEVESFFKEVEECLKYVSSTEKLNLDEKSAFFKSVSRNFGRTALCLSGGGSLAYYHIGVIKTLFEQGTLPEVITGTSGGSLIAAFICTRTDQEIIDDGILDPHMLAPKLTVMKDSWIIRMRRLLTEGHMFDPTEPFQNLEEMTKGHLTFLEAYQKTGRILCIPVCPDEQNHVTPVKVLNFLTAPDVIISSAICASCAIPLILPSIKLLCKGENGEFVHYGGSGKRWRDGSIRSDIPDLSMLNVQFQIVSQVNPHVTMFFYESQGSAGCPTPHRGGRGWKGGFLASSLIHMIDLDLKKWLRLCKDLKLLPPIFSTDISSVFLQQFEGSMTILPASENVGFGLSRVLNEPETGEILQRYINQGERKTWPKLGMIGHRMRIENVIKRVRQGILEQKGIRQNSENALAACSSINDINDDD